MRMIHSVVIREKPASKRPRIQNMYLVSFKFQHKYKQKQLERFINKSLGSINRNKTILRTQLEYASTVWRLCTQTCSRKIEMVQRRTIRWTLNNSSSYDNVSQMQTNLGLRFLDRRRLCMLYTILHGLVAIKLPPYFQQPSRMTRQSHPLALRQIHASVLPPPLLVLIIVHVLL